MTTRTEKLNRIQLILEESSMEETLEILGNLFIQLGASGLETDKQLTPQNIAELTLKDIEKNGENFYNSILRQGLIILSWLDKDIQNG